MRMIRGLVMAHLAIMASCCACNRSERQVSTVSPPTAQAVSSAEPHPSDRERKPPLEAGEIAFETLYSSSQNPSGQPHSLAIANGILYVAEQHRVWEVEGGKPRQLAELEGDTTLVGMAAQGSRVYFLIQEGQRVTLAKYEQRVIDIAQSEGSDACDLTLVGDQAYWLADNRVVMSASLEHGGGAKAKLTLPNAVGAFLIHQDRLVFYFPEEQELGTCLLSSCSSLQRGSVRNAVQPVPLAGQCPAAPRGVLAAGADYLYGIGANLWRSPWSNPMAIEHFTTSRCVSDTHTMVVGENLVFLGQPGNPDSMTRRPGVVVFNSVNQEVRPWFDALNVSYLTISGNSLFILGYRQAKKSGYSTSQVRRLSISAVR
jgi:hypothetical protein